MSSIISELVFRNGLEDDYKFILEKLWNLEVLAVPLCKIEKQ